MNTKTLEEVLIGMRIITIAVLFYILGYSLELIVFFKNLFSIFIDHNITRLITAVFIGGAFGLCLFLISFHRKDKKSLSIFIAVLDGILILIILKINNSANVQQVLQILFVAFFKSFVGYHLIQVFVKKINERITKTEQSLSDIEQNISKKKDALVLLEQKAMKVQQKIDKSSEFICEVCEGYFPTQKSLNGHKRSCKS